MNSEMYSSLLTLLIQLLNEYQKMKLNWPSWTANNKEQDGQANLYM